MSVRLSTASSARLLRTHVPRRPDNLPGNESLTRHGCQLREVAGSPSGPQIAFAKPKSSTFTLPCGVTFTLAGFKSR